MVAQVIGADDAARLVSDGATITLSGVEGIMYPELVASALEARFLAEGHPRDLTWFDPTPTVEPVVGETISFGPRIALQRTDAP